MNDFSEINLYYREGRDTTALSLENSLNQMIEQVLGKGWRIAVFNSSLADAMEELTKGNGTL